MISDRTYIIHQFNLHRRCGMDILREYLQFQQLKFKPESKNIKLVNSYVDTRLKATNIHTNKCTCITTTHNAIN